MDISDLKILRYSVVVYHRLPKVMSISTGEGDILTIKQIAEYLKVTDRTIYKLAAAKKIPAFKVGGTWRFSRADIDRWIAQQTSVTQTDGSTNPLDSAREK
jgi:excisionase family DNA binding protein